MNNYLKAASERYRIGNKKNFLIHPVSIIDAEIISEIIITLDRIKTPEDASEIKMILDEFKYLKDEEIRDLLLQWNIEHQTIVDEEETDKRRKFIQFENQIIEVKHIYTVGIEDKYNFLSKKEEYLIILNKDLEEKFMLTNGVFKFPTPEERNKKLNDLKRKLNRFIKILV